MIAVSARRVTPKDHQIYWIFTKIKAWQCSKESTICRPIKPFLISTNSVYVQLESCSSYANNCSQAVKGIFIALITSPFCVAEELVDFVVTKRTTNSSITTSRRARVFIYNIIIKYLLSDEVHRLKCVHLPVSFFHFSILPHFFICKHYAVLLITERGV